VSGGHLQPPWLARRRADPSSTTARVPISFPVFIPKIIARFSWMQNTYMMDPNDRLSLDNMHYLYYNLFRGD